MSKFDFKRVSNRKIESTKLKTVPPEGLRRVFQSTQYLVMESVLPSGVIWLMVRNADGSDGILWIPSTECDFGWKHDNKL